MESYIKDKKELYTLIRDFLENSDDENLSFFEKLTAIFKNQGIVENHDEMQEFLYVIKSISDNHHRSQNFMTKIEQILEHYQNQIKQTMSNVEIFHIFESNKLIILYLIQKGIIEISEALYKEIISKIDTNGNRYCYFFYTEIEKFIGEKTMKYVKDELISQNQTIFNNYELKRREGENDSYVCSLIRQDSVIEFITYLNHKNISPSSQIPASIFETNQFLIDNEKTSLIEYSAFFGSIQIFQYLMTNNAELKPSLWLYAIHSQNAEIIMLLESNKVDFPMYNEDEKCKCIQCYFESIKCHHNDIASYIENNLMGPNETDLKEEIISKCIEYHNYDHFQIENINDY